MTAFARFCLVALPLLVTACGMAPIRSVPERQADSTQPGTPTPSKRGGFYLDDGPGDNPPPDLDKIPDAIPRPEKLAGGPNRPYVVFGKQYVPFT